MSPTWRYEVPSIRCAQVYEGDGDRNKRPNSQKCRPMNFPEMTDDERKSGGDYPAE